ncbi:PREDICTED: uncharacterized protein LOC101813274 [Ficedula albicollis]|uniref:uncharacterized protein LOC101813274 n=1 Tax=Ficedula albicollis TaxID=59894 RepID=UPI0003593545|nr:PREDICTED: uncharacterized protein LOC101813274 [Ficedula albicollis]
MATGADWNCPICREASSNIAYVGNCLHQFCHSCIVRWARKNPSCPLCRRTVHTIIYPAGPDHDFVQTAVPRLPEPQNAGPRDEPRAAEPQPQGYVAGLSPETWALCFRTHAEILRPVELWLDQVLFGACWWDVVFAQGRIVASLCRYGLHEEALTRELQPFLREQTLSFVRRLIEVVSEQCSELAGSSSSLAESEVRDEAEKSLNGSSLRGVTLFNGGGELTAGKAEAVPDSGWSR